MDGTDRARAYDRGHTIFSPNGRLYQVEYARRAVERGSPSVGVRTEEGVVLAARKRLSSPLLRPETVSKLRRVDDHVAVASAGHAADARRLVDEARRAGQRHRLTYGESTSVESMARAVADHVQETTQAGGSRPYGAALLVGGVDDTAGPEPEPALFEVDPSGTPYGWDAIAVGDGDDDIRRTFESTIADASTPETVDEGVTLSLDALRSVDERRDESETLDQGGVAAVTVTADGIERIEDERLGGGKGEPAS